MDTHHSATVLIATDLQRQPNNLHRALAREAWLAHPTVTIEYDADSDRLVVRFLTCPTAAKVQSDEPLFLGFDGCDEHAWPTILTHLRPSEALTASHPSVAARQMLDVLGGTAAARVVTILQGQRSTEKKLVLTEAEAAALVAGWSALIAHRQSPAGGNVTDAALADALSQWSAESPLGRTPGSQPPPTDDETVESGVSASGVELVVSRWRIEIADTSRLAGALRGLAVDFGTGAPEAGDQARRPASGLEPADPPASGTADETFVLDDGVFADLRGHRRKEHERPPTLRVRAVREPARLQARLTVPGGLDEAVDAIAVIASTAAQEVRIALDLDDRDDVGFLGEVPWPASDSPTTPELRIEVTRRA